MRVFGMSKMATAALVVAMGAGDAFAWGHRGSSSSGSYGSSSSGSYGSSSSGSYGSSSSGSYGSSSSGSSGSHGGGLFARWHARKAARASSSSGSYGSSSSGSYGSHGSYASSGSSGSSSSYGSYGSYGGGYYEGGIEVAPMEAQPMLEGAPEATPPTPPQPAEPAQASIRVNVPADAMVFVNDRPTTSTGESRHYISRNLMAGRTYAYELRVEYQLDGKAKVENKTVRLQAGSSVNLAFGSGEQMVNEAPKAKTKVTLHVPATAKVTLAGAETRQTGETRTFITSTLNEGQQWDGYVVRVELERDGQTLVEEKNLAIEGGQSYELSFDFANASANHVAAN